MNKNFRSLFPFPITVADKLFKSKSEIFRELNSDTLIPDDINNSKIALCRGVIHPSLNNSICSWFNPSLNLLGILGVLILFIIFLSTYSSSYNHWKNAFKIYILVALVVSFTSLHMVIKYILTSLCVISSTGLGINLANNCNSQL